jgi:hypothetical protein
VEHSDTLLTIAELAVALAGFASLVSIIGRRRNDATRDSFRLRMMLEVSFRNALFALLPLPFLQLVPSDPIIWRISSGLYLVAIVGHTILRLRTNVPGERSFSGSMWVLVALTVVAGVANVLGLGGSYAFSLYLANLLLGLFAAGLSFISVADSVFGIETQ